MPVVIVRPGATTGAASGWIRAAGVISSSIQGAAAAIARKQDKDHTAAAIVGGAVALGVVGALLADKDKDQNERRPAWIVRCESDGDYQHCRADTRNGARLYRQLSRARCQYNDTWGYDRRGIWVEQGCRAEFAPP